MSRKSTEITSLSHYLVAARRFDAAAFFLLILLGVDFDFVATLSSAVAMRHAAKSS
jgi:hypothetical protein